MVLCFAPGCNHRSDKPRKDPNESKCSFRKFPTDQVLFKKWVVAVRRNDRHPDANCKICSCHFTHNSPIPTVFSWNASKRFNFKSPEKRKRRTVLVQQGQQDQFVPESSQSSDIQEQENSLPVTEETPPLCPHSEFDKLKEENETQRNELEMLKNEVKRFQEKNKTHQNELEMLRSEVKNLKEKNEKLLAPAPVSSSADVQNELPNPVQQFEKKEEKLAQIFISLVMENEELFKHYSGLSFKAFDVIYELLKESKCEKRVIKITEKEQLLLTLMKLRKNLSHIDLALKFGVCKATVSKVFSIYIAKLHTVLFKIMMSTVPSRHKNALCLPKAFDTFPNCRMIIDCTEVPCDVPSDMEHQKMTYSTYKHMNTFKFLIGCAPNGTCTYCSECYPGSFSDKLITEHCGVLDVFEPGDLILADKGFTISDLMPEGVSYNIPPFKNTPQFSTQEIYESTRTAQARIHIERVINRLKKFRILRHISQSQFHNASMITQVCASLVNFQSCIIKAVEQSMSLMEEPVVNVTDHRS